MRSVLCVAAAAIVLAWQAPRPATAEEKPAAAKSVFAKENLVAWCIVPFDAKKRGPAERAEMLRRLGIGKLAYDWRDVHVPTFEDEIVQLKKQGVELFAFWSFHPAIVPLLEKYQLHPQIWKTVPSPAGKTQRERIEAAGKALLPLVETADKLGCQFGLYNHGGWGGEPENMVAVAGWLREHGARNVGIVYNLHHGHGHVEDFAEVLALLKPYLLCLNLNGMKDRAEPMIVPIGSGEHEQAMMEIIRKSGYRGPIGILDHRGDVDSEEALRANLDGMQKVLERMGDEAALKTYRGEGN